MVRGMVNPEIHAYYEHGFEQDRLVGGRQRIEFLRVWDLLERHLPPPPAQILDIGGGAGAYAVPLYHLTSKADRIAALREARRAARPGGLIIAKALSRFYPVFENLTDDMGSEPGDFAATARFLTDGQYRNDTGDPAKFTTSYFHRPEELTSEIQEADLELRLLAAASGPVKLLAGTARRLEDPAQREYLLSAL